MKRILTYGTFDIMHYGHLRLLRRAKALGDQLFVGLSTDDFNRQKNKTVFYSYEVRKRLLENSHLVDFVFPEENWEQKISDVRKYQIDTFVMGDDWAGKFDFLKPYCEVLYLPRTPGISTSLLKKKRCILKKEEALLVAR